MKPHLSCHCLCYSVPWLPWTLLGSSGSPPLLLIVAYWIDLLSRVFRSKTKWGSHGWPISAVPFNSVVKRFWLAGLGSTVYKKILWTKSPFSHRPVWHQCQDDLLLESLIARLCCCSVWVSLATTLSYTEPKYLTVLGESQFADMYFSLMTSLDGLCVRPADVIIVTQWLGDAACPFCLLPQAARFTRRLPLRDCQLSCHCKTHRTHFSWYNKVLVFSWEWYVQAHKVTVIFLGLLRSL